MTEAGQLPARPTLLRVLGTSQLFAAVAICLKDLELRHFASVSKSCRLQFRAANVAQALGRRELSQPLSTSPRVAAVKVQELKHGAAIGAIDQLQLIRTPVDLRAPSLGLLRDDRGQLHLLELTACSQLPAALTPVPLAGNISLPVHLFKVEAGCLLLTNAKSADVACFDLAASAGTTSSSSSSVSDSNLSGLTGSAEQAARAPLHTIDFRHALISLRDRAPLQLVADPSRVPANSNRASGLVTALASCAASSNSDGNGNGHASSVCHAVSVRLAHRGTDWTTLFVCSGWLQQRCDCAVRWRQRRTAHRRGPRRRQ